MTAYQFALTIAAPIATALAILGVVVVRGTKITEFRQAWINTQRDDIATLVASSKRIARRISDDKLADAWLAFDAAIVRIRLRRNPKLKWWKSWLPFVHREWADVMPKVDDLEAALVASPIVGADINDAAKAIVDLSGPHLKREWNRTRRGELGFKLYIVLAPLLIGGPLLIAVGWILDRWFGFGLLQGMSLTDTLPIDAAK